MQQKTIELITVLHRLLLTSHETQDENNILDIVEKCALALHEKTINGEKSECNEIGETEISAKKSVVFSILEVCTFVVSKYANDLVIDSGLTTANIPRKPGRLMGVVFIFG